MKRSGPFKGRTISVVNDLSLDEQRYLYRKSRELKTLAMSSGDCSAFKINDLDYQVYLIFMEDSTRTRESFRNAAKFRAAGPTSSTQPPVPSTNTSPSPTR